MKRLTNRHFWLLAGLILADGLFFGISDPSKSPSIALIIGFVLLLATLYEVIYGLLAVAKWYGLGLQHSRRRLAGALCGLVGVVLALQSAGQLGLKDMLVLVPFVVGLYLYLTAAQPQ